LDNILYSSTVFCSFLPLITIFALTPYISRRGSCFGVLLMEDAQKSFRIKRIKRGYSVAVSLTGIAFSGVCFAIETYSILGIALVSYCAACISLYLACNSIVNNLVMRQNWENLQKEITVHYAPISNKKAAISSWWYCFYLLPCAGIWYISINTSLRYVFVLPITSIAVGLVVFLLHLVIKNSSHYMNKKNFEKSIEENIKFRKAWSRFVFVAGFVSQIMLIILQLGFLGIIRNNLLVTATPFAVTVFITASSVVIAIKNNQK
jgi:uncharacterized membrane protein